MPDCDLTLGPGCWACGYDSYRYGHAKDCYNGLVPDYDDWEDFARHVEWEFGFQDLAITVAWENALKDLQ
jgi:hypothetical protein